MEQVEVFCFKIDNPTTLSQKMNGEINRWLNSQGKKIEITSALQSQSKTDMGRLMVVVTIFYKLAEGRRL